MRATAGHSDRRAPCWLNSFSLVLGCLFYARRKRPELAVQPVCRRFKPLPLLAAALVPFFLRLRQQLVILFFAQALATRFPSPHFFCAVVFRIPVCHSVEVSNIKNRLFAALVVLRPD